MKMLKPIEQTLESNPSLGWLSGLWGTIVLWVTWIADHPTEIGKWFGLLAGVLGFCATYYTLRIQRRTWQKMNS